MKSLIRITLLLIASNISFFAIAAEKDPIGQEAQSAEEATNEEIADDQGVDMDSGNAEATKDQTTEAGQPLVPRYLPSTTDKRAASLLEHMSLMGREDEVVTLSNLKEAFYGLYLPQASRQPQGGILILHDEQQHGHWPDIIGPLREYLPLFGWSTLTIELPDQLKRQRIPREIPTLAASADEASAEQESNGDQANNESSEIDDPATKNQETENQEAKDNASPESIAVEDINGDIDEVSSDENEPALPRLDKLPDLPVVQAESQALEEENIDRIADYQAQNRQRIKTAIEYLQQQNQYNLVIIGFGRGASWAIDFVHQQIQLDPKPKGLTLITIDALPNIYDKDLIHQQLADISLPYLDLLQSQKQFNNRSAAKRLAIMRRNNNPNYQQIITPEISSYNELENPTNRRIRGWIKSNASGTQIAIKPE